MLFSSTRHFAGAQSLILTMTLLCALLASGVSLPARDKGSAADKEVVTALELGEQLSTFYANFTGIIEVTLGRAADGVTDTPSLRLLTLAKLRLARACRAAAFQIDPRNALIDTWSLCVQLRLYAASDAPSQDLGLTPKAIPLLRDASLRIERDIILIATQFLPPDRIAEVTAEIEIFCKAHPLSSVHAVTPPPAISASANTASLGIGKILSLPLAPFHALEGVDHTAQAVAAFARVVDSVDRTVSNLPMETAWETEILLLDLKANFSAALDEQRNTLSVTLRELINFATVRALEVIAAIFLLSLLHHFITRRWFPKKT